MDPYVAPMMSTSSAAHTPTSMDTRVPTITRTMMSRPNLSVPNTWGNTDSPAAFRSSSLLE